MSNFLMQFEDAIGEVVTIKTIMNNELIAQLHQVEKGSVTLYRPRQVLVSQDGISAVPFTFTGNSDSIIVKLDHIFSIEPANAASKEDYLSITTSDLSVENEELAGHS